MKLFRYRLLIAALAVLMGSAIAKSQTPEDAAPAPKHGHQFSGHGGGGLGFMFHNLTLTEEQKTQMKSIMQKEHPAMKPLFEQERQIEIQLRQYVEGTFDQAKVQALAAQKAQIEAQRIVAETRIHNELYQLLTPEQQSQLK